MKSAFSQKRELFLQNHLARAASLLFHLSRLCSHPLSEVEKCSILFEIDEWFSEVRQSLSAELSQEEGLTSDTSAPIAGKNGAKPISPLETPGPSPHGLVRNTPTTESAGVSLKSSSGGTSLPEGWIWKKLQKNFFSTKPKGK
jgi:hypothetical protein